MKRFWLTLVIFFLIVTTAIAGSVTLQWSPNSEPDLAGYRVFAREAGQGYDYSNPSWEGTNTTCIIENLSDAKTYFFVARAFDTEGYESGNSNEVSVISGTIPDGLPPGAPTINVTVTVTTN